MWPIPSPLCYFPCSQHSATASSLATFHNTPQYRRRNHKKYQRDYESRPERAEDEPTHPVKPIRHINFFVRERKHFPSHTIRR